MDICMRAALIALAVAVGACAADGAGRDAQLGPSPFPVERGSTPPPPVTAGRQAPPPEGRATGGIDFGAWRQADPAAYAPAFQSQIRARLAGKSEAQIRADLAANGFTCQDGGRLDCRIEIMERECAFDWYVVLARGEAEPAAGYDIMCLGAR